MTKYGGELCHWGRLEKVQQLVNSVLTERLLKE